MRLSLAAAALIAAGGCFDDDPALTDATELHCPTPGNLPFRLETSGFGGGNAETAETLPRYKSEATDTIGNPGGLAANVYLEDGAPASADMRFRGLAARTATTNGLFSTPLPEEDVSLWHYDSDTEEWSSLARTVTDENGFYDVSSVEPQANGEPVYAMLEADGSCAEHYTYLYPPGTKIIVSDIDGTLTLSDNELFEEIGDPTYVQKTKTAAAQLTHAWADKGYPIVYITARSHVFRSETRRWLRDLGFATGPAITANTLADAAGYKTLWLQRMIDSFGWVPVVAYGNAVTDIQAYENAGIAKDVTFIIGENAGNLGTVAIENDDYTSHIAAFVTPFPAP
jgi:hypothetical protein